MRKFYGQSRTDSCPFCGAMALSKNSQGIPVCLTHKNILLNDMKCACGEWLDLRTGKFGAFFSCMKCGNISFRKALEMNPPTKIEEKKTQKTEKKEITITSDDPDYF